MTNPTLITIKSLRPLFSFNGEIAIARTLMNANCQVDHHNSAGQTAGMYAALFNRTEILRELQNKGADIHALDAAGNSAASLATGVINTQYRSAP